MPKSTRRSILPNITNQTGAIAISASASVTVPSVLTSVTTKFSAAPAASENYTITWNKNAGAAYDVVLYSVDPSVASLTSIVWLPDNDIVLEAGDSIDVAFVNTNTRTHGTQITLEDVR